MNYCQICYYHLLLPCYHSCRRQITLITVLIGAIFVNAVGNVFWYRLNKEIQSYAFLFSLGILPTMYTQFVFSLQCIIKAVEYGKRYKTSGKTLKLTLIEYLYETILYPCRKKPTKIEKEEDLSRKKASKKKFNHSRFSDSDDNEEIELGEMTSREGDDSIVIKAESEKQTNVNALEHETKRMRKKNVLKHYINMSLLDVFLNLFAIVPVLYFSAIFVLVFNQLSIPLNITFSYFILKRRYNIGQLCSIFFIIISVLLANHSHFNLMFLPAESSKTNNVNISSEFDPQYDVDVEDNDGGFTNNLSPNEILKRNILMIIYFAVMKTISALIMIYKEWVYQYYDINEFDANVIISLFQLPISWISLLIFFIPFPNYIPVPYFNTLPDLWNYIINGFNLFLNPMVSHHHPLHPQTISTDIKDEITTQDNSIFTEINITSPIQSSPQQEYNQETMVFILIVTCYIVFLALNNTLDIAILKRLNSTFMVLISAVVFLSTVFLLSIPEFAGKAHSNLDATQITAVILVVFSSVVYWYFTSKQEEALKKKAKEENVPLSSKTFLLPPSPANPHICVSSTEMTHQSSSALNRIFYNLIEIKNTKYKIVTNNHNNSDDEDNADYDSKSDDFLTVQAMDPDIQNDHAHKIHVFKKTFFSTQTTSPVFPSSFPSTNVDYKRECLNQITSYTPNREEEEEEKKEDDIQSDDNSNFGKKSMTVEFTLNVHKNSLFNDDDTEE